MVSKATTGAIQINNFAPQAVSFDPLSVGLVEQNWDKITYPNISIRHFDTGIPPNP